MRGCHVRLRLFFIPCFFRFHIFPLPVSSVIRKSVGGRVHMLLLKKSGIVGSAPSMLNLILLILRDKKLACGAGGCIFRDIFGDIGHLADHVVPGLGIIPRSTCQHITVGMGIIVYVGVAVMNQPFLLDFLLCLPQSVTPVSFRLLDDPMPALVFLGIGYQIKMVVLVPLIFLFSASEILWIISIFIQFFR